MNARPVSLVCPDGHGPLRDMAEGLYCSAADHDGRPSTHRLGTAPATKCWFTYAELLELQHPTPASAPVIPAGVRVDSLSATGPAPSRTQGPSRRLAAGTTADPAGGSGSAPLLSSTRASSSSSRRRADGLSHSVTRPGAPDPSSRATRPDLPSLWDR